MRWNVLVTAPYMMPVADWVTERLSEKGCDVRIARVTERLSEAELMPQVGDVHGIICGDDQITERVLAAAPLLKVISKWGTGIDSIDCSAARSRHVAVRNTPNAFSEPVGDTVFASILTFARQPQVMMADMRQGTWVKRQLRALNETTIGIIGVGNCGSAVAKRAAAFGMRTLGCDRVAIAPPLLRDLGVRQVALDELLAEADFVSLNVDLNETSFHLIAEPQLRQMKSAAILVNTSRGAVVDEQALVNALAQGWIAGAALDVFEVEPLPLDSPLRHQENCLLSPHNANSSAAAARKVHESTLNNLLEELSGCHQSR